MRIVSLLPAATDWLVAFGAGADLVGRSHACAAVPGVPALTRAPLDPALSADAIDAAVRAGRAGFGLGAERLAALRPDVVVTQETCAVCAPAAADLRALVAGFDPVPEVVGFDPVTWKGVLDAALGLGRRVGRLSEAMACIAGGEARLRALHERLGLRRDGSMEARRPKVAVLEWLDPPMSAGHWTPDVVEMAGGRAVCAAAGGRSRRLGWDELAAADPDVLVLAPCGRALAEARRDAAALRSRLAWCSLRAARAGRAWLLDGDRFLNRPGPDLYRAAELLAAAFHPERAAVTPAPDEMARIETEP